MRPLVLVVASSCLVAACSREGASAAHVQTPPATPTPAAAAPATPAAPPAAQGADFSPDVRLLYRVVACGGDEPLPPKLDAASVDEYCKWLLPKLATYQTTYVAKARPFLAAHRPAGLPTTVVYPFGGGDLLSALLTYPDGLEFTTLSLEHAGDPRRLKDLDKAHLAQNLAEIHRRTAGLFTYAESTSENMMQLEKSDIPGQLAFFVVGLAAHGYEPVSLRYFRLEPDGGIHYLTAEEIATDEKTKAQRLNRTWVSPEFSVVFSNSEIVFRPKGKEGPLRVHRHIAVNLSDESLRKDPSALKYLEAKGTVSAMTKAASYLLWAEGFSKIKNYLLGHMAYMFSDSTGIPPSDAAKAGFEMETYGKFKAPFLIARASVGEEFKKLWASQPYRELNFRYGYPDKAGDHHLLITRPKPKEPAPGAEAPAKP
jgi:hypothetical protein